MIFSRKCKTCGTDIFHKTEKLLQSALKTNCNCKKLTNIMRGYKKLNDVNDIEKLHDILWEVEYFLDNNIIGGSECALERVRDNIENIRAWGQEWKIHAKEVDPKVPEHQQPQNLPKWGSLT